MSSIPQNLIENQTWPSQDTILVAHGRICDEFGRLEQLRSSLLTTYEKKLKIPNTLYTPTPRTPHKLLKKEYSAILLYSSSFTAWYCVATWFILPDSLAQCYLGLSSLYLS